MINYYLITKPGIILGNLLTVAAGFILGLQGKFDTSLFFSTLIGLTLIMASACVFNNFIDRKIDKKMNRTKNRALVKGTIAAKNALSFATILLVLGTWVLFHFTNLLATCIAIIGFFVYVILYSMWKARTIHATAIGSIAGGVPPLVGYCAVTNHFDLGAWIFFAMMFFWQMPHFFAIAILHFEDYVAASIPAFPILKGMQATKKRMVFYLIGFVISTLLFTFFHYTGFLFLLITATIGIVWLLACIKGFQASNDKMWAKNMFRISLVAITAISLLIPIDHYFFR